MDTVKGLATEEPQLSPLYFILPRFWVQSLGPQVTAVRSLSAWISLLLFPRVYWLCWELFRSASVGWMAVTIVALGLFHVLYGQEARPYMMFAVLVLLQKSTAKFKSPSKLSKAVWSIYAIALSLGLYSSLLFFLVAFAHGIYVIRTAIWRFSKTLIAYLYQFRLYRND